jgi:Protein of unknown function (DUF1353).
MKHSIRHPIATLFLFLASTGLALSQVYGTFEGTVQTEWLPGGRGMRLLSSFSFVDPSGQKWEAPKDWVVDGASIPQFAWSFIGGPFEGRYREASVIHDVGCDQKTRPWNAVHEAFYWAMRASRVESWRAKVMYAAVYHFGPRWERTVVVANVPQGQTLIARQKALVISGAPEGSVAEIVNVRPHPQPSPSNPNQQRTFDFDIRVIPPKPRLTIAEFEKLKDRIERVEQLEGGGARTRGIELDSSGVSLADIRSYKGGP